MKIRIGIFGYGNLGVGTAQAVRDSPDMELKGIFSRRALPGAFYRAQELHSFRDALDVLILCGGSAKDLPEQSPALAREFTIVDSFDTHQHIPAHFAACDAQAKQGNQTAVLCAGWDPGLFSLQRVLCSSILPGGVQNTFWGPGVSQGHSDAIRQIPGVLDARQYTVPNKQAIAQAREGEKIPKEKAHRRLCYVAVQEGADLENIRTAILTMPNYFAPYETEVVFTTEEALRTGHRALPHGGRVIHTGLAGGQTQKIEYMLQLSSNPAFTGAVLTAYARAAYRLKKQGCFGGYTPLDIPVCLLSPDDRTQLYQYL